MLCENDRIRKWLSGQTEVEMPMLQKQFSLSYANAKSLADELLNEGVLEYMSGVKYKVHADKNPFDKNGIYRPRNEMEANYIRALWACVDCGKVSTPIVQRRGSAGYCTASVAIDWMEANGFVSPREGDEPRRLLISRKEFIEKFGVQEEDPRSEEDRRRELEERRHAIMERMRYMYEHDNNDDEDEDDDDEEDEEDYSDDVDDDEEDIDMGNEIELLLNRMSEVDNNEADNESKFEFDVNRALRESFALCLQEIDGDEKKITGLNGGAGFELKVTWTGKVMRYSDGGRTFAQANKTPRKIKNILKDFGHVALNENNEIYVESEDPESSLMAVMTLYAAVWAVKKMK